MCDVLQKANEILDRAGVEHELMIGNRRHLLTGLPGGESAVIVVPAVQTKVYANEDGKKELFVMIDKAKTCRGINVCAELYELENRANEIATIRACMQMNRMLCEVQYDYNERDGVIRIKTFLPLEGTEPTKKQLLWALQSLVFVVDNTGGVVRCAMERGQVIIRDLMLS